MASGLRRRLALPQLGPLRCVQSLSARGRTGQWLHLTRRLLHTTLPAMLLALDASGTGAGAGAGAAGNGEKVQVQGRQEWLAATVDAWAGSTPPLLQLPPPGADADVDAATESAQQQQRQQQLQVVAAIATLALRCFELRQPLLFDAGVCVCVCLSLSLSRTHTNPLSLLQSPPPLLLLSQPGSGCCVGQTTAPYSRTHCIRRCRRRHSPWRCACSLPACTTWA